MSTERLNAIEKRLRAVEQNVSLCLNYVRDIAQHMLSKKRIEEIERDLNGHDTDPAPDPEGAPV